ncbi:MAG TPA: hypothetical protein DEV93_18260 [Chloroflexi bacterium]|nr:hypothetical protein [Chloroflexota bacterium]
MCPAILNQTDLFEAPPKATTPLKTPEPPVYVPDPYARPECVLSLGDAATRLGISRGEPETMIEAGTITALPTGYALMVPSAEIERLRRPT